MGADSFLAFYGVKFALDPENDDEIDACGEETDPRCIAAKRVGLDVFSGRMSDGQDYFLFVGRRLAWLGLEHDKHSIHTHAGLSYVVGDVDVKLQAAGIMQLPSLHMQFIGQY